MTAELKYFVSPTFEYLGAFIGAEPPAGSIEVPTQRPDASSVWNGSTWVADFAPLKAQELAKFRNDRKEMFSVIVGMGWAASESGDTTAVTKLLAFRKGLKDLPEWPAVVAATTHAGLKTAMAARYKTLTDALPAAIKADFKKLYVP